MSTEAANQPSGIRQMYEKRGQSGSFGPPTYTSQEFLQKIAQAAGLEQITQPVRVLDSMSGPGLLISPLQKLAPQHLYYCLDLVPGQLLKITGVEGRITSDARQMPFKNGSFQVGLVRYAAKDIPQDQQPGLFDQMYDITAPDGVWVLADMYAPLGENDIENGQIYEWLNRQHTAKQERSGRDRAKEGTCHIPPIEGWLDLFKGAGFRAYAVDQHISNVATTDWLSSNQVTEGQLKELNHMILTAPTAAKRAFNIREEEGSVKIDYPVTIIRAVKH